MTDILELLTDIQRLKPIKGHNFLARKIQQHEPCRCLVKNGKIMLLRISMVPALLLSVAACGGGGGGGSSSPSTPAAGTPSNPLSFEGFSKLKVDKTTRLTGVARVIPFSVNGDGTLNFGNTEFEVTSADITPSSSGSGKLVLRQEGQPNLSFGANDEYSYFYNGSILAVKSDGTGFAVFADETQNGHEYQSYGAWVNTPNGNSGWANAASFGKRTPESNIPTGTSATYTGNSVGIVASANGASGITDSQVSVSTDFSSATLTSSNTWVTDPTTGVSETAGELDFSTTINDVQDGFGVGSISTATQSGTASVGFYGPNAEEVGGEWGTTGTFNGSEFKYGAAYGGKR